MSEHRKKPAVAFWSTLMLLVLLAYPVSFGPACWISSRAEWGREILTVIYRPILRLMALEELSETRFRLKADSNAWERDADDSWEEVARGGLRSSTLNDGILVWYAELGAEAGAHWEYVAAYGQNRDEPVRITREEWNWLPQ